MRKVAPRKSTSELTGPPQTLQTLIELRSMMVADFARKGAATLETQLLRSDRRPSRSARRLIVTSSPDRHDDSHSPLKCTAPLPQRLERRCHAAQRRRSFAYMLLALPLQYAQLCAATGLELGRPAGACCTHELTAAAVAQAPRSCRPCLMRPRSSRMRRSLRCALLRPSCLVFSV